MTDRYYWSRGREFPADLFVIDPAGCGCSDCITGDSTPADQVDVDMVLDAMRLGMRVEDRR